MCEGGGSEMAGLATQLWRAGIRDVWASDAYCVERGCIDVCIRRNFGGRVYIYIYIRMRRYMVYELAICYHRIVCVVFV